MDVFLEFRTILVSQVDHLQEQLALYCRDTERLREENAAFHKVRTQSNTSDATGFDEEKHDIVGNEGVEESLLKQAALSEDAPSMHLPMELPGVPGEALPSSPLPPVTSPRQLPKDVEDHKELVIQRWALLAEGIWTIPAAAEGVASQRLDRGQVQLRSMWNLSQDYEGHSSPGHINTLKTLKTFRCSRTAMLTNSIPKTDESSSAYIGEAIRTNSMWQHFIWHPDNRLSLLHALVASLLITYDVISFPLIAFDVEEEKFFTCMTWVTTIFWTCDIPMSFLQGYHSQGVVEMRPKMVARHYLRTWLIPDLIIVSIDWALILFSTETGGVLRAGKATRSPRFLRAARVLRLIRTLEAAAAVIDAVANETMIVAVRVFALLLFILAINHYVACGWYALAEYNKESHMTWLSVARESNEGDTQFAKYIMSLSWSLTQFTPATNDITPANVRERVFATITILFAFVLFSFLVSSLTNAMMEIKNLNMHKHNEERLIREFLGNKKVSLEVGNRIWHYYRKHYKLAKKAARESDINFFKEIPSSLRTALHTQIFMPVLLMHPLFDQHYKYDPNSLRQVCNVLEERCLVPGFELFSTGDMGNRMYFLTSGTVSYDCPLYVETKLWPAPLWISEAALWAKWVHCGHLLVHSSTEMLQLDAHRFEKVMQQYMHEVGLLRCLRKYATLYAHHVSNNTVGTDAVTDIHTGDGSANETLKTLSHRAFASSALGRRTWQSIFLPDAMKDWATGNSLGDDNPGSSMMRRLSSANVPFNVTKRRASAMSVRTLSGLWSDSKTSPT